MKNFVMTEDRLEEFRRQVQLVLADYRNIRVEGWKTSISNGEITQRIVENLKISGEQKARRFR